MPSIFILEDWTFIRREWLDIYPLHLGKSQTGYIYDDEKEFAKENGYGVVDLETFIKFLECHKDTESEIFKSDVDWGQWLSDYTMLGKL